MLGSERLRPGTVAAVYAPELRAGGLRQRRSQLRVGDPAGGDYGDLRVMGEVPCAGRIGGSCDLSEQTMIDFARRHYVHAGTG
jgi:hypothetical protein